MNRHKLKYGLLSGLAAASVLAEAASAQPARQPALQEQLEYAMSNPAVKGPFQVIPLRAIEDVRGQDGKVTTRTGVYVLQGPDGNVTVQIGPEGSLVIDSSRKANAAALVAALEELTGPHIIRFHFTTNGDPERTEASDAVASAGKAIFGGNVAGEAADLAGQAVHMSHENVLNRLSGNGKDPAAAESLWPKETYAQDEYDFHLNDEGVQFLHVKNAHTDGDSIVFLRRSDVIVAGDLWDTTGYPRIDVAHGGSVEGLLDGLNQIIRLTIPGAKQEGGTLVIPGRGRPGDEAEVVEYRDMVTIIRDRIKELAGKGMTLDQIKAARPTEDYDGRYGSTTGPWTTDMFISAVYQGVKPQPTRGRAAR